MSCPICADHGYVRANATRIQGRFLFEYVDSFRIPCSCEAGERWTAMRVAGLECDHAPASWREAVVLVLRDRSRTRAGVAMVMGLEGDERVLQAVDLELQLGANIKRQK